MDHPFQLPARVVLQRTAQLVEPELGRVREEWREGGERNGGRE